MISFVRAGLAAAFIALALVPASAADKPFKRGDLGDAAIKLEAQIKQDAGPVTKSLPTLRKEADAAFKKRDFRTGMLVLSRMTVAAPQDAGNWLRLARTVREIVPRNDSEKTLLLDRASTAAYIAYQRATDRSVEADSLALLGQTLADRKLWRPALDAMRLSLNLRETAELRGQYERLRTAHGFRMLDYSVDSECDYAARLLPVFSETLPGRRTTSRPSWQSRGVDKPAVSVNDKQLCVEGLKHGQRYRITLRAGLPSTVHEALAEVGAIHRLCARPQSLRALFRQGLCAAAQRPARHSAAQRQHQRGQAQCLPHRRPQPGQYACSATISSAISAAIRRENVALRTRRKRYGAASWRWNRKLNAEVTAAYPVDKALGTLEPGVYVMTATPKDLVARRLRRARHAMVYRFRSRPHRL